MVAEAAPKAAKNGSGAHAPALAVVPDRFDEALAGHRAQTERIRAAAASMREMPATPVEVPSLVLMERVRRELERHVGCGECADLARLLADGRG
jgi:hypothetical protein